MNREVPHLSQPSPVRPRPPRKSLPQVLTEFRVRAATLGDPEFCDATFQTIVEQTGSTDFSLTRLDASGSVRAALDWPWSAEKEAWNTRYGHTLLFLLTETDLLRYMWEVGPGIAFGFPDSVYRTTPLYRFVYRPMGAEYVAAWYTVGETDGLVSVFTVSRRDRDYNRRELRALQAICQEAAGRIIRVPTIFQMPLERMQPESVVIDLDPAFLAVGLSLHAEAVIALYFGLCERQDDGPTRLPELLERRLRHFRNYAVTQFGAGLGRSSYSFSHTCRGRRLSITFAENDRGGLCLRLAEDIGRLEEIARIRQLCDRLSRDRYSTLAICMSLLDGITESGALMQSSGLGALKPSSAQKLISRARGLIDKVVGTREGFL